MWKKFSGYVGGARPREKGGGGIRHAFCNSTEQATSLVIVFLNNGTCGDDESRCAGGASILHGNILKTEHEPRVGVPG